MNMIMKDKLNELALNLAQFEGYHLPDDYDFKECKSPRGIKYWNMAVLSWVVLKDDSDAIKFQR